MCNAEKEKKRKKKKTAFQIFLASSWLKLTLKIQLMWKVK